VFSLRNRFGIPGVIAVIALVFAMLGGAYAASSSQRHNKKSTPPLNSKQKTEVEKIAKKFPGPPGPQGPAGTGQNGGQGPKGDPGASGAPGQRGASVILVNEEPGSCHEEEGFTYEIEGSGEENEVCNGEPGVLHPGETLPEGATETGVWTAPKSNSAVPKGASANTSISFPIPLISPPTFVAVKPKEDKSAQGCSGTVNEEGDLEGGDVAASGTLCVYLTSPSFNTITLSSNDPTDGEPFSAEGVSTSGIVLNAECVESFFAECIQVKGVWAVTG
jgi:hypothetical protein